MEACKRDKKRDKEMMKLREKKWTYKAIAAKYGISKERVRQLFQRMKSEQEEAYIQELSEIAA